ncbi:UNVERIFIED_CONTAM: hypothetical protein FKN15_032725 [Acipenser sinensis]
MNVDFLSLKTTGLIKSSELEFQFPVYKKEEEENEFHLIDSLSFLSNDIVGEDYVVCGDEKGDLWTYEVSQCLRAGAKTDKMIPPTQILEWPAPKRKGHGPIVGTSVNSVAMDPELQYLVALTDKNIAAVWRRA